MIDVSISESALEHYCMNGAGLWTLPTWAANSVLIFLLIMVIAIFIYLPIAIRTQRKVNDIKSTILAEMYHQQTGSTLHERFKNYNKWRERL